MLLSYLTRKLSYYITSNDEDFQILSSTTKNDLIKKLPGVGSLAPTDWGTARGTQCKLTSATVRDLGKLDAIVVGSGLSALTFATVMSMAGWRILVLERADKAGGRGGHTREEAGFECDPVTGGSNYFSQGQWLGQGQGQGQGGSNSGASWLFLRVLKTVFGGATDSSVLSSGIAAPSADRVSFRTGNNSSFSFTNNTKIDMEMLISRFPSEEQAILSFADRLKHLRRMAVPYLLFKFFPALNYIPYARKLLFNQTERYGSLSADDYLRKITSDELLISLLKNYGNNLPVSSCPPLFAHALSSMFKFQFPLGGPSILTLAACEIIRSMKGQGERAERGGGVDEDEKYIRATTILTLFSIL